jgi:CubicO group peptidase (beta-lactamase class C family)
LDYAKTKLFGPLGIEDAYWREDPQGNSCGGYGLYLKPRDMAKIGYLYLRDGVWEDKQLIPPAWIDQIEHATVDMHTPWKPGLRYSNLFWALPDQHVYMAVGHHGQVIMIFPDLDIVAVTTSRGNYSFSEFVDLVTAAVKSDTELLATRMASKCWQTNYVKYQPRNPLRSARLRAYQQLSLEKFMSFRQMTYVLNRYHCS